MLRTEGWRLVSRHKASERRTRLAELAGERRTLVFYEAPHRLAAMLKALTGAFGPERRAVVARELTKVHEEVRRATLGEQWRAQQQQAEAEADRFRLADLRYRNGVASYLDVLDAQRALFASQQALAQIRLALQQNQVAVYKALGGGWVLTDAAPQG